MNSGEEPAGAGFHNIFNSLDEISRSLVGFYTEIAVEELKNAVILVDARCSYFFDQFVYHIVPCAHTTPQ